MNIPKVKFDAILGINANNLKNQINLAWVFGVIFFIISFAEYPMDFLHFEGTGVVSKPWYIAVKIISVISFTMFIRGFVATGSIYKNDLLSFTGLLFILFNILAIAFDISSLYFFEELLKPVGVAKLVVFGIIGVLFGVGILQLKKHIGTMALVTGILMIVSGFCVATVIFAPAYLFLGIPLEIM